MAKKTANAPGSQDPATENFNAGLQLISRHPLFGELTQHVYTRRADKKEDFPADGWAIVVASDSHCAHRSQIILCHPKRHGRPEEWAFCIAHCLLHLGLEHYQKKAFAREWNAACCAYVCKFLLDLKFGRSPEGMVGQFELPARNEERLYDLFCRDGIPPALEGLGTYGCKFPDITFDLADPKREWQSRFGDAIAEASTYAVNVAGGLIEVGTSARLKTETVGQLARRWFINHFPLLGSLAASFTLIEDPNICYREQISVAAVNPELREIYINSSSLTEEQARFVMAHEFLHVGLRHETRRQGRDNYLWNVACDYVINGWLIEMQVGRPVEGLLLDDELKGLSAESIYDRLVADLRRYRKLITLRGSCAGEHGDILDGSRPEWWLAGEGITLDEFYRRALTEGLALHEQGARGYLPSGLVEAVRALMQPPIPWDVELAQWFDHHFPLVEKTRTYARPSRRQSSTPDIPRASYVPTMPDEARTFGVVLDTSGSMDRALLSKALGAISSYAIARDVPMVRVIFCDAAAYDQGYMAPEEIAGRVKVKGRGGTVLQPGVDLLEKATNFPEKGPILLITDGWCDHVRIKREHAFLLPDQRMLPFVPIGKVFRLR